MRPLTAWDGRWSVRAGFLADFALTRLVNRRDVWGEYLAVDRRYDANRKTFTAPAVADRGTVALTLEHLVSHFRGECTLGVHAVSLDNTSLWMAFDLDAHDGAQAGQRTANLERVSRIVAALRAAGCHPILEASCDRGGLHVWVLFDAPVETASVFWFAQSILAAADAVGIETFPRQPYVAQGQFGSWLRLPGRHHSRPWWSRVEYDGRWVEGADAAVAFLYAPITSAAVVPARVSSVIAPAHPSPLGNIGGVLAPNDFIERRLLRYIDRVGTGLSDGRNTAAFSIAQFLFHSLALSDEATLRYCEAWNQHNVPPLQHSKLVAIVRNARRYGHPTDGTAA